VIDAAALQTLLMWLTRRLARPRDRDRDLNEFLSR